METPDQPIGDEETLKALQTVSDKRMELREDRKVRIAKEQQLREQNIQATQKENEQLASLRKENLAKVIKENEEMDQYDRETEKKLDQEMNMIQAMTPHMGCRPSGKKATDPVVLPGANASSPIVAPRVAAALMRQVTLALHILDKDEKLKLTKDGKTLPPKLLTVDAEIGTIFALVGDCVLGLASGNVKVLAYEPAVWFAGRNEPCTPNAKKKLGLDLLNQVSVVKMATNGESIFTAFDENDKAFVFDYLGNGRFRLKAELYMPCVAIGIGSINLTLVESLDGGSFQCRWIANEELASRSAKESAADLGKTFALRSKGRKSFQLASCDMPYFVASVDPDGFAKDGFSGLGYRLARTKNDPTLGLRYMNRQFKDGEWLQVESTARMDYMLRSMKGAKTVHFRRNGDVLFESVFGESLASPDSKESEVKKIAAGGSFLLCLTSDNKVVLCFEKKTIGDNPANDQFDRRTFSANSIVEGSVLMDAMVSSKTVLYVLERHMVPPSPRGSPRAQLAGMFAGIDEQAGVGGDGEGVENVDPHGHSGEED